MSQSIEGTGAECPRCAAPFDVNTPLLGKLDKSAIDTGDMGLCSACGEIVIYHADGMPRTMTLREWIPFSIEHPNYALFISGLHLGTLDRIKANKRKRWKNK